MKFRDQISISGLHVLDGGMATELEFQGADISGPLWSAHVLETAPEKVIEVHRAYLDAGAEVLLSASYQVSRFGYQEFSLSPSQADSALLRSVDLAVAARRQFLDVGGKASSVLESQISDRQVPGCKVVVAASLGPYGAALHNGAEYHGNYDLPYDELVKFHRQRIEVLMTSDADLFAFETLPSLEEARAIGEAMAPWPAVAAWFTFNCPDSKARELRVAHGEYLRDCAGLAASFPQTVAVGVNCTCPDSISSLILELKQSTSKPIVVYPNSGECWDSENRCWTGDSDALGFGTQAAQWFSLGAQIIGGCCRTRPDHIRQVAEAARSFRPTSS